MKTKNKEILENKPDGSNGINRTQALEKLAFYSWHKGGCEFLKFGGIKCNCGLAEARNDLLKSRIK